MLLVCTRCNFVFYQNPKPCAGVILTNENNEVLLTKRSIEPKLGTWDIPGGFLEDGEDPIVGVQREIREELGITIQVGPVLGIYVDTYDHGTTVHTLNIYYACTLVSGEIHPMDDISEAKWFSADAIPWDELAFKHLKTGLRDWIRQSK